MTVSTGFYKKIKQWVMDEQSNTIAFKPFQANGNPYKSNIFILNASPEPYLQIQPEHLELYANSLVDPKVLNEDGQEEVASYSREYKGCLNFQLLMKEQYKEEVVITSLNSLFSESEKHLTSLKKVRDPLYERGKEIFQEVLNEFSPKILIVQGTTTWKAFLNEFEGQLADFTRRDFTVQQLESLGSIAKLPLSNGEFVTIFVCRSMSYFGKNGTSFKTLQQSVIESLR